MLALALALAQRLPQNHAALARGVFDHESLTRGLSGAVGAILGFGGIGRASAKLFEALGAHVRPIGRGATEGELDAVLAIADVLVVSVPLTRATRGLIGRRELELMKPDGRGPRSWTRTRSTSIFSARRRSRPASTCGGTSPNPAAGSTRRPFSELSNVVGSPHNSGNTDGTLTHAAREAAQNIARHLRGEPVRHLVDRSEYRG
jgi:phosphoglycerate dehydrogenase-like enzyme